MLWFRSPFDTLAIDVRSSMNGRRMRPDSRRLSDKSTRKKTLSIRNWEFLAFLSWARSASVDAMKSSTPSTVRSLLSFSFSALPYTGVVWIMYRCSAL